MVEKRVHEKIHALDVAYRCVIFAVVDKAIDKSFFSVPNIRCPDDVFDDLFSPLLYFMLEICSF